MERQVVELLKQNNQLLVDLASIVLGAIVALIIATAWRR